MCQCGAAALQTLPKSRYPSGKFRRWSRTLAHTRIVFLVRPGRNSDQNLPEQWALIVTRPHSFRGRYGACADRLLAVAALSASRTRCAVATDTRCDETLVARAHLISSRVAKSPPYVDPPRLLDDLGSLRVRLVAMPAAKHMRRV